MDTRQPLTSVQAALQEGTRRLAGVSDTPGLDAQVLLASLLGKPRAWLLAHPEAQLDPGATAAWQASLARVEAGEPLPYVLGKWEFFNLEFEVTPQVLIPRPETELLVECAIPWLKSRQQTDQRLRVLDVGTGSGCIAIALAANLPGIEVVATDISPAALEVARRNAGRLVPSTAITFVEADLFPNSGLQQKFDLVAANLPYIPDGLLKTLPISRHEPLVALAGGTDGLAVIRRFLAKAPGYLEEDGLLLMEIEASQGEAARKLAQECFHGAEVQLLQDLSGRDRLVEVHLNPCKVVR